MINDWREYVICNLMELAKSKGLDDSGKAKLKELLTAVNDKNIKGEAMSEGEKVWRPDRLMSIECEQALIGGLLFRNVDFKRILSMIDCNDFYREVHSLIFQAIEQVWNDEYTIDILTVMAKMQENGNLDAAGGEMYLFELAKLGSSSPCNFYDYARIIKDRAVLRESLKVTYPEDNNILELAKSVLKRTQKHNANAASTKSVDYRKSSLNKADLCNLMAIFECHVENCSKIGEDLCTCECSEHSDDYIQLLSDKLQKMLQDL